MATPSGEQSAAEAATVVGERLTVADIATGATVRIVAAKEGSAFAAETVQLMAAVQAGRPARPAEVPGDGGDTASGLAAWA